MNAMASVALDHFPAKVTRPTAVHERARVVVGYGRAAVFDLSPEGAPRVLADVSAPDPHVRLGGLPYSVTTEDDGVWTVEHGEGCGCGSILRALPTGHLLGLVGVR